MINNFMLEDNFNLKEFECTHPDHNHVIVDSGLVSKLQELRERLNTPLIITSGFRCDERNKQVGGAEESYHLEGKAVDISTGNIDEDIDTIYRMAVDIGFSGIGLYDSFIHLDTRLIPARWGNRY